MTTTELRGHPLTVADVGLAAAAMGYACWCQVLLMVKTVDAMSPQVAGEVRQAVDMLRPYLVQRERGLTAAALTLHRITRGCRRRRRRRL